MNSKAIFNTMLNYRGWVITIIVVVFLGLAAQVSQLRKDTSSDAFISPTDQSSIVNNEVKDIFGLSDLRSDLVVWQHY